MAISSNATGLRPGVCTSTTRPTNPYTGQIIYETDTGYLRVWDGSAWDYLSQKQDDTVGLGPVGGLVYLNSTTFTSTTSVALNGWLNSAYEHFRLIVYDLTSTNFATCFVRLRLGTTSSSASYYTGGQYASYQGVTGALNQNNSGDGWYGTNAGTGTKSSFTMDIRSATVAVRTQTNTQSWADDGTGWTLGGEHTVATAYDGLELRMLVNMTGKVVLYGYRKS